MENGSIGEGGGGGGGSAMGTELPITRWFYFLNSTRKIRVFRAALNKVTDESQNLSNLKSISSQGNVPGIL